MKIQLKNVTIGELAKGFKDNQEEGVIGFNGKLDIRPPYQREFVYKDKQREAVIDTVTKNYPLNVMYWAKNPDGSYEVIDGQQRTISICQYISGKFSFKTPGSKAPKYFHNLANDEREQILNYPLMIYICEGSESQKLEWFKTINIAGEKLTNQELRNAVYAGPWIADAKRYFSKNQCAAYEIGSDYVRGTPIRQEYFEKVLSWISEGDIEGYMAAHQHDQNALHLWRYFQDVISWVAGTFPVTRTKLMRSVEWGLLYNQYKDELFDTTHFENEIQRLILDDDVTKKSGIYEYLLTGEEKHLSIRAFSDAIKLKVYEEQKGICPICGNHFKLSEMEADHITPWSEGGETSEENCQMLCRYDNRRKGAN